MIPSKLRAAGAAAVLSSLTSCAGTAGDVPALQRFLPVLETFADAAVRLYLTDSVRQLAPTLFVQLDADQDGHVTVREVAAADLTDPALVAAVLLTIDRLVRNGDGAALAPPAGTAGQARDFDQSVAP